MTASVRHAVTHACRWLLAAAGTGVLLLLPSSCEHKELCFDHPHGGEVQVVFDWADAPDASPESMRLWLFPEDGSGSPEMYEFAGHAGGRISIPAGRYKAISLNSDTESILYRNTEAFETFEVYTPDGTMGGRSSMLSTRAGERVAVSPDRLYTAHLDEVTIRETTDGQTVTLCPQLSVCRYRISIKNVANLNYVVPDGVSGAISGMAGGFLVGQGRNTMERVTVPFQIATDGTSELMADFLTFGGAILTAEEEAEGTTVAHELRVDVTLTDGTTTTFTFDVSAQVNSGSTDDDGTGGGITGGGGSVDVGVEELPLPKPQPKPDSGGGGFRPTVDEWQDTAVDIPL